MDLRLRNDRWTVLCDSERVRNSTTKQASPLARERGRVSAETSLVRILVVDDFEPFRRFLSTTLLKPPQFEVVGAAADGLDAVHKAEELKPDLILLDLDLPKLNGIEVARRVRDVSPESRILFVSAETFPDIARMALDAGASGYVVKFDVGVELLVAIDAVLLGKRYLSPRLAGLGLAEDTSA